MDKKEKKFIIAIVIVVAVVLGIICYFKMAYL